MKFVTKWKDEDGKYRDETIVWVTPQKYEWKKCPVVPFGDIEKTVVIPKQESECVQDLQAGSLTCYMADTCKTENGETVIYLVGNGWAEALGFPFSEEYGGYPLLGGKTADKFLELAAQDVLRDWKEVYSGDIGDLVLDIDRVAIRKE